MLFLSAGHCNIPTKDQGAIYPPYTEGLEAVLFVQQLKNELDALKTPSYIDKYDHVLNDTLIAFKNVVNRDDIAIDIHFNASTDTKATGTEIVIGNINPATKNLVTKILSTTATLLNIKNRGIKTEADSQHARLGFLHLPCNAFIFEICFISNPSDMKTYKQKQSNLIKTIALLIKR